ncbi:Guanine nucleotide exchange factor lte1 [Marasmius sp. AFHP31]|nr:Guanine nucleotide exchange factor lte1 [Marasmius sp. AFHP31]
MSRPPGLRVLAIWPEITQRASEGAEDPGDTTVAALILVAMIIPKTTATATKPTTVPACRSNIDTTDSQIATQRFMFTFNMSGKARRESTSLPLERPNKRQTASSFPRGQSSSSSNCHNNALSQGLEPTPTSPFVRQTTSLPNGVSISQSTHANSQDTLLDHTSSLPSYGSKSTLQTKGKGRMWTRSERYEFLLLRCKLGFPLWVPSPRCTPDGEYYMPEIGDVGVLSHGLPFNTIFNITQPLSSLANKDGVPEGFDPPCNLKSRWITIKERKNPSQIPLFQPRGAILDQKSRLATDGLSRCNFPLYTSTSCVLNPRLHPTRRVFTFDLSETEGALLMLPRGSILRNLENTAELGERARLQWRQWYDYANGQMNPEDGRALYLVTGVERCRTWAMAAWDAIHTCDRLGSLELTVDGTTGACSWMFPPARCSTEVSDPPTTDILRSNQETVFIRGFWIDIFDGEVSLRSPGLSSRPAKENDGNDNRSSNLGGSSSQGPSSSSSDSSSDPSSSTHPSFHVNGCSGASDCQSDLLDPAIGKAQILELELNMNLSDDEDDSFVHPCKIINNFAFELISKTKPALLDVGFAALSHDEAWISIVEDSDEEFPSNVTIIQRICSKFKFTIDGDVIYTVSMTDADKELLAENREALRLQSQVDVISVSVLVMFAEDSNSISHTADQFEALSYEPSPLARSNGGSATLVDSYDHSLDSEREYDNDFSRIASGSNPHAIAIRLPIRAPYVSADNSRIKFVWPENEEVARSFAAGFPAEHTLADFSIAPDGSFVETSSGAAAIALKRKYDNELDRNVNVKTPYAITAFMNQYGRRTFRIGHRDLSAPATAGATAEDQSINRASSSSSANPLSSFDTSLSTQISSTTASSRRRSGRLSMFLQPRSNPKEGEERGRRGQERDEDDVNHQVFGPLQPEPSRPPSPSVDPVSHPLTTGSTAPTHRYLDPLFHNEFNVPPVPKIPEQYRSAASSPISSPSVQGQPSRRFRELPRPPASAKSQSTPRPLSADSKPGPAHGLKGSQSSGSSLQYLSQESVDSTEWSSQHSHSTKSLTVVSTPTSSHHMSARHHPKGSFKDFAERSSLSGGGGHGGPRPSTTENTDSMWGVDGPPPAYNTIDFTSEPLVPPAEPDARIASILQQLQQLRDVHTEAFHSLRTRNQPGDEDTVG